MQAGDELLQIRSYRVCFDLERRLHRIDRWRIPLPYGLPLRGAAYAAALLALVLVAGRLPIGAPLMGGLHPTVRYVVVPLLGAFMLMRWNADGRVAHLAILSWLRMWSEPRRIVAFRRAEPPAIVGFESIAFAPDERGTRLRRGVVRGAGRITFRYPIDTRARRSTLHVRTVAGEALWRGKELQLERGQRVVIE